MNSIKKTTVIAALSFLTSGFLSADSARDFVDQAINAMGGKMAISRMQHFQAQGRIELESWGISLIGKLEICVDNSKIHRRLDLQYGKRSFPMIDAFDGKIAWQNQFGRLMDVPALNFQNEQAHDLSLLINPEVQFVAKEKKDLAGQQVQAVEAILGQQRTTFYFNIQTHLPVEIDYKDFFYDDKGTRDLIDRSVRYEKFESFDGILFPTQIVKNKKGKKEETITITSINFHPKIKKDLFDRPIEPMDFRWYEEMME